MEPGELSISEELGKRSTRELIIGFLKAYRETEMPVVGLESMIQDARSEISSEEIDRTVDELVKAGEIIRYDDQYIGIEDKTDTENGLFNEAIINYIYRKMKMPVHETYDPSKRLPKEEPKPKRERTEEENKWTEHFIQNVIAPLTEEDGFDEVTKRRLARYVRNTDGSWLTDNSPYEVVRKDKNITIKARYSEHYLSVNDLNK